MSVLQYTSVKGRAMDILEELMVQSEVVALPDLEYVIRLVLEELVVNISSYAYGADGDGPLSVTMQRSDDRLTLVLDDEGTAFDPLQHADPDITQSIEERPIGGLGILLVKQMMDDVTYNRQDGHNILTLTKQL